MTALRILGWPVTYLRLVDADDPLYKRILAYAVFGAFLYGCAALLVILGALKLFLGEGSNEMAFLVIVFAVAASLFLVGNR